MQEDNKNNCKEKIKIIVDSLKTKVKNKKILVILIAIIIFTSCIMTFTIPRIRENIIKASQNQLLKYEVIDKIGSDKYKILITIKCEDGLEYIKYPNGDVLYPNGKTVVGIDYQILEEVEYDFTIKVSGKDETVETIYKEVAKIKGDYGLVNGVYLNKPDLSGFDKKYARYLECNDQGNMTPGNWISEMPNGDWYDYKQGKWANIYFENNGANTYYVWIPRYCFKLDQETQRSDVKFIDTSNNYIDENGKKTTWQELSEQGYQIPEAFEFKDTRIPGYWANKYTAGDITTPSTINYDMSVLKGTITIRNIKLNASITNSNPITKFTIALNGKIIKTIEDQETISNINSQVIEFSNMIEGDNVVNVTGLNAKGEIVGSMTKVYSPAVVNEPDLSGFDKETTFYVTYDENGNEHSTIPITEEAPKDWYEYGESRWANIVTRNNSGLETYYTWIPRYEFKLDQTNQRSTVKFLKGITTQTTEGYQIPEAFTFNGQEILGYWANKYTSGPEATLRFDTEVVATNNSIRTKGIIGTAKADGQVYKYYINGQYKGEKTSSTDTFEYTGLNSNTKYTILVEIRNSSTDEYLGTIVKQISTIDANKPDLSGFSEENTYYVIYDDSGNESIGSKIKKDGSNMPNNWYSYSNSKWANIVVTDGNIANGKIENATQTTYYTWIPRYEFMLASSQQAQKVSGRTEVRFINGTSTDVDVGYQIPEAFKFNGQEIPGYWANKYTAGN